MKKIWNPRAFKGQVSPHEVLQQISSDSRKKFSLTKQGDPIEVLSWLLNALHSGLGGSRKKSSKYKFFKLLLLKSYQKKVLFTMYSKVNLSCKLRK